VRLLRQEVGEGITELSCHPGFVDSDLVSSYSSERAVEVETLCSPEVREGLECEGIQLVGFSQFGTLSAG
jgi:predicted glycoside hydrolase/deacetylase ChbG (UPF0249 family)